MRHIWTVNTLLFSLLVISSQGHGQDFSQDFSQVKKPRLEGRYLGQKPPGLTAEPFAPSIVNTHDWGDAGHFSPDMNEFYVIRWRVNNGKRETQSVSFKKVDHGWQQTATPYTSHIPFDSPDGKTQYFGAQYRELTETGWSEMKSLGPAFEAIRIMGLTASRNGTLVLDEMGASDGDGVIRYSRLVDGKHQAPKPLPEAINTGKWNAHPFIAADESYLIWNSERESGYGDTDLYISFRQPDGAWGEAINLGNEVNTKAEEGGAQVTPDGKYLFFNRMVPQAGSDGEPQSDLYWIDAQIIEQLRPKTLSL
ncbi:TolB-like translocation protein [Shewanella sedimentimangrovi]|uniref:PD40 domain-containing protein n=1 Tax=Shewanella sedimentimangrovi TaxID=2814293 RepID=A0ABX7QVZ3_9GAMM|nr:PD40 domain-containing protein [Shewanella sedimentimangrovi]QSX35671.1 PD40 domain-containing protein [Shewanella sedimentimangrovi]